MWQWTESGRLIPYSLTRAAYFFIIRWTFPTDILSVTPFIVVENKYASLEELLWYTRIYSLRCSTALAVNCIVIFAKKKKKKIFWFHCDIALANVKQLTDSYSCIIEKDQNSTVSYTEFRIRRCRQYCSKCIIGQNRLFLFYGFAWWNLTDCQGNWLDWYVHIRGIVQISTDRRDS